MASNNKVCVNIDQTDPEHGGFTDAEKLQARQNIGACGNAPDDALYANYGGKWANVNFVTPEMFGAVGDGVTDDTAAIQAAMNACSVVVFGAKTYIINVSNRMSGLMCNDGQKLFLGNCTLKAHPNQNTDGKYVMLHTNYANHVLICGGHIVGDTDTHASSPTNQAAGILVANSNYVTIENVEIEKVWADGITVNPEWDGVTPWGEFPWSDYGNYISISNCHIHHCRRQGISVVVGTHISIDKCVIHDISGTAPEYAIDVEPDGSRHVSNVIISRLYNYGGALKGVVFSGNHPTACVLKDSCVTSFTNPSADCDVINTTVTNSNQMLLGIGTVKFINCILTELQISGTSKVYFDNCVLGETRIGRSPLRLLKGYSPTDEADYYIRATNCRFNFGINGAVYEDNYFGVISPAVPSDNSRIELYNCEFNMGAGTEPYNRAIRIPNGTFIADSCVFKTASAGRAFQTVGTKNHAVHITNCFFINYTTILRSGATVSVDISNCNIAPALHYYLVTAGTTSRTVNLISKNNVFDNLPNNYVYAENDSDNYEIHTTVDGDLYVGMSMKGPSTDRPTGLPADCTGYQYFDTDLSKTIVWNGTTWVNVDGTALS